MSDSEQLGGLLSIHGNQYQHIQVREGAIAQLGNTFHISREDPLSLLPFVTNAPFNSYDRQHEPACLSNTRVDLLREIYNWADREGRQDERCIFWLSGLAGTGKSTISRTVARTYYEQKRLGASFFFSKGDGDTSHAGKFFTSFAVQLAYTVPSLQTRIRDAVRERSDIASLSLLDQWRQLVLGPLSRLEETHQSYVFVVDALDECEGDNNIRIILELLAEVRSLKTVRLRVFLTSRSDIIIRHGIKRIPQAEHQDFILHNIPDTIVNRDITLFLEYNLGMIRQEWSLGVEWPGEVVLRQLTLNACGLFIWAATACRFIREGKLFARRRLDTILKSSSSGITAPEKHLNEIYLTVVKHSISSQYSDEEREEVYDRLKHTLGSIVVLLSPLSTPSLSRLLYLPMECIDPIFEDLYAILDIPEDPTRPLRLHHPSFRDFLFKKERSGEFWVDEKEAHQKLAVGCIQLMSQTLKKDICEMHAPGSQLSQVESSWIEKCLPPEVQYACLYWVQHLQRSGSQVHNDDKAYRFLQAHLLHWLEALGWMGKTSEGIIAILSLEAYVLVDESPKLHALIHDAKRFTLYNRSVIEQAPLQLYCSALIFAPEKSVIRETFGKCIPTWIGRKPRVQAHWSAVIQTLQGHSGTVYSVAFSSDDKQVVSGSSDDTVRLWDATTGAALQTLQGHSGAVHSVAFSPDDTQVVSGSNDCTVRLWDVATGAALRTLEESHSGLVHTVAFSPDGKQVVSGSNDETVRFWDATTGAILKTLEGHSGWVRSVAFSSDGKKIGSGSYDNTVQLWDATTGAALQIFKGHFGLGPVHSVAFSPDGTQVVSTSDDNTVRLWDAITGAALQTLQVHSGSISVAFSPDGKQVVSGSNDNTVQLWDATTGAALQTLKGHSGSSSVYSVAFSSDGKQVVSGSSDCIVRFWDATTGTALQTHKRGHSDSVHSVAFSPDGKQVVSGSKDFTIRLWDAATGAVLQTFKSYSGSGSVYSVAFSPDGKQVVSGSSDCIIQLWDATTGAALQTLKGHLGLSSVYSVAFSPDGKQVVSGSKDCTVRLWDAATGAVLQTFKIYSGLDSVYSVAFSPDGKQVVSGSSDCTIQLWDVTIGTALQTLKGHFGSVHSVAFSPDGKQVVSGSNDGTVRLWDATTGAALQTLKGHSGSVHSVAFSPSGKLLPTLHVFNYWLVDGTTNVLWLPTDYRVACEAARGELVVLGHLSGRVSFLQ